MNEEDGAAAALAIHVRMAPLLLERRPPPRQTLHAFQTRKFVGSGGERTLVQSASQQRTRDATIGPVQAYPFTSVRVCVCVGFVTAAPRANIALRRRLLLVKCEKEATREPHRFPLHAATAPSVDHGAHFDTSRREDTRQGEPRAYAARLGLRRATAPHPRESASLPSHLTNLALASVALSR